MKAREMKGEENEDEEMLGNHYYIIYALNVY
jgi:hypothetical protein